MWIPRCETAGEPEISGAGPIRKRVSKLLHPAKRFHDFFFLNVYPAVYIVVALTALVATGALERPVYRQMAEWPAGMSLWLAVGLCVAAISFFHSPQIAARSVVNLSPRKSQGANKPRPLTKTWATGPAFFIWTQIRSAVLTAMFNGAVYIFMWWFLDTFLSKRSTMFSEQPHNLAANLLFGFSLGHSRNFSEQGLRHFRVLPRSTRTLAAVLTLLPVLFFLCSWVVPVAAYRMMSGHLPWAMRLELLFVLAGLSSLLDSVALSAVGTPARILSALSSFMAVSYLYTTPLPPWTTGLIGLLGLASIAAAFVLNVRALRDSSSIYKSVPRLPSLSQPRWISE